METIVCNSGEAINYTGIGAGKPSWQACKLSRLMVPIYGDNARHRERILESRSQARHLATCCGPVHPWVRLHAGRVYHCRNHLTACQSILCPRCYFAKVAWLIDQTQDLHNIRWETDYAKLCRSKLYYVYYQHYNSCDSSPEGLAAFDAAVARGDRLASDRTNVLARYKIPMAFKQPLGLINPDKMSYGMRVSIITDHKANLPGYDKAEGLWDVVGAILIAHGTRKLMSPGAKSVIVHPDFYMRYDSSPTALRGCIRKNTLDYAGEYETSFPADKECSSGVEPGDITKLCAATGKKWIPY